MHADIIQENNLTQRISLEVCYNRSETDLWNNEYKTATVSYNDTETQTIRSE